MMKPLAMAILGALLMSGCVSDESDPVEADRGEPSDRSGGPGNGDAPGIAPSEGAPQNESSAAPAEEAPQNESSSDPPTEAPQNEPSTEEVREALPANGSASPAETKPRSHVVVTESFDYTGSLPSAVLVNGSGLEFGPSGESVMPLYIDGTLINATITLTWEASFETTRELELVFGNVAVGSARVQGTSPLALALDEPGWGPGRYVVEVRWSDDGAPIGMYLEQQFTIQGKIVYLSSDE